MIVKSPRRRTGEIIFVMTLAAGLTAGIGTSARADDPLPRNGESCSFSEVGRQIFKVDSAVVTPVVTHFGSFNVTRGTLSENTYHLSVVNYVNTGINNRSDGSQTLFESVSRSVGFSVQRDRATTNTEDTTVKWTFNEPGYYALYKGTKRVTGAFRQSVCVFGFGSPRYMYQGRGTYTTYGHIEEGTVVCGDKLPAGTVRAAARVLLSCPATPAAPKR